MAGQVSLADIREKGFVFLFCFLLFFEENIVELFMYFYNLCKFTMKPLKILRKPLQTLSLNLFLKVIKAQIIVV